MGLRVFLPALDWLVNSSPAPGCDQKWRSTRVVGVFALRTLRPRRAGGTCGDSDVPLDAARRLAARAVLPH